MIYFTSDLHLGHDRFFIWYQRGFKSVEEMNEGIISRWNSRITDEDDVYILGDLVMGGVENVEMLERLNGKLHIIFGNHDGPKKREAYAELDNVIECGWATELKYRKYTFFLSHYPTMVINDEIKDLNSLRECPLNLFGHTHQELSNFYNDDCRMYHVGVDSHNCYPVAIDDVINSMKRKFEVQKSVIN